MLKGCRSPVPDLWNYRSPADNTTHPHPDTLLPQTLPTAHPCSAPALNDPTLAWVYMIGFVAPTASSPSGQPRFFIRTLGAEKGAIV